MAERSIVEILLRARGGRAVASETGVASRGVDKLGRASSSASRRMTALGTAAAATGVALGYGLYRGARKSLEAFAESEKVGAQTVAVLKSTGQAAGVSQARIEDYAAALQQMSGVDDEAIQSAENMILTFRDIRGKAFKPTLDAALNMSAAFTAMGKDMSVQDAAMQLGKAMNDPTRGMSRLQRIGVTFTQDQIDQASALQDSNDMFGAQRIILRELNKEFGGSAKAAGQTTAGAMDRLSGAVENAQEAIGMGLAPAVSFAADGLSDFVNDAIPDLARLSRGLDDTFARKDLDMAGKLAVSARQVRKAGKPYVEELVQGLKDAHLDDKLEDTVEWAVPKIAHGAAIAGTKATSAFFHAWMDADPWAKIAISGFAAYKLRGPLTAAGKAAAGWFGTGAGKGGSGLGGALGGARGATPATPVFVEDVTGRAPGSKSPRKAPQSLARRGLETTAKYAPLALPAAVAGFGVIETLSQPANTAVQQGRESPFASRTRARYQQGGAGPVRMRTPVLRAETPLVVQIDGKTVAQQMARYTLDTRERDRR